MWVPPQEEAYSTCYVLAHQQEPRNAGGFPHWDWWELRRCLPFPSVLWHICEDKQPSEWELELWGGILWNALCGWPTIWTAHLGASKWVPGKCTQEPSIPRPLQALRGGHSSPWPCPKCPSGSISHNYSCPFNHKAPSACTAILRPFPKSNQGQDQLTCHFPQGGEFALTSPIVIISTYAVIIWIFMSLNS